MDTLYGNFLGKQDDWAKNKDSTFLTKAQVLNFFKDFDIIYFSESKYIKDSVKQKDKRWHVYEIYARKK